MRRRLSELDLDLFLARPVKDRCCEMQTEDARSPAEVRLKDLPDVHARRHAQRIENDFDGRSVRQVRHIFFRQNARDDALVAVSSGHLVADRKLALHGDEDLDHLDNAGSEFVALTQLGNLLFVDVRENLNLPLGAVFVLFNLRSNVNASRSEFNFPESLRLDAFQHLARDGLALRNDDFTIDRQVFRELATFQQFIDTRVALLAQDANLVLKVTTKTIFLFLFDCLRTRVFLLSFAREDLHVN